MAAVLVTREPTLALHQRIWTAHMRPATPTIISSIVPKFPARINLPIARTAKILTNNRY
jgi:hypothetical protein